ncbi:MAG: RNA polymerase sigma factor [Candidatus Limnocylindria bacterium]
MTSLWSTGPAPLTYGRSVSAEAAGDPIAALRARDESAWRALHDREFPLLYRYALGLGAGTGLAEDAVSEAFTRLLKAIPDLRIDGPVALRSWLIVVCRNYVRDELRKTSRTSADAPERFAPDADPTTRAALYAALAALPETQRDVIVLRFVTGLPTREVAALTGRGIEAVESLQHRALEALRRALGPEWSEA